jgi:AmmeMemoRadiSam system protein A
LLEWARYVAGVQLGVPATPPVTKPHGPVVCGGLFVSLWLRGTLRGCVGSFAPVEELITSVEEVTKAALDDPRFRSNPLTASELPETIIEFTILSPLERCDNSNVRDTIEPGRHGVMIRRGTSSGCFLPRVAKEQGWTAEELLSKCCSIKAGLPQNSWRSSNTAVYRFEAISFSEEPKTEHRRIDAE